MIVMMRIRLKIDTLIFPIYNDVSIDSSQLNTSIKIKQEETVSVNVDGRNKILSSSLLKIKTNVKHEENSSDNMEDMNVSNNDKEIIFQQLEKDINDNESSIIKQHMHQVSPSVNANDFDSMNNNASSINKQPTHLAPPSVNTNDFALRTTMLLP